jgi:hypothetical protein
MRGTERVTSPAPHVPKVDLWEHEKRQEPQMRFPPTLRLQNSSSMPPCTVCTTRAARCAGSAL